MVNGKKEIGDVGVDRVVSEENVGRVGREDRRRGRGEQGKV